jgi:hypothetical protein
MDNATRDGKPHNLAGLLLILIKYFRTRKEILAENSMCIGD